ELVYQVAEGLGAGKIVGLRLPSNQGLSGWVMENGAPALVNDTEADPRFNSMGDERTGYATKAMICAPIQFKGQVLGTIQAINPTRQSFDEASLELLVNLANIASSAFANAQQFARTLAAEERYLNLFQGGADPIILTDFDGRIVEANKRAIQFFDYGRDELLGKPINYLHRDPIDLAQVNCEPEDEATAITNKIITSQQQRIPVEIYVIQTRSGDNTLLQWVYHDISKQLELEQMREDLTAMLYHDLQSPLGNVISSLELLNYEIPPDSDPALMSMLDIARRSSSRLQSLIRSLLDINQLEAGHPINQQKVVTVNSLVDDVYEMEQPGLEKRGITFARQIPTDIPDVYVERDMIRRVLMNLVDNALKYSQSTDVITVSASHLSAKNKVHIAVSDQGVGIPEEYRALIFEKFERIKRGTSSKGLGLGLAFCRLAVEAHDGRIWVDDTPGGGARFNFTLPIRKPIH
ncbi:MAG: ATP-binding protein, partial [Anaerolineae bacterium]